MRVKHVYHWGYFHPVTGGADRVAANHLGYFKERGWAVDCVMPRHAEKEGFAARFRAAYPWLDSVTLVDLPPASFGLRDLLFAYDRLARDPAAREALAKPADLFLTNYAFTAPLVQAIPTGCKRVMESIDIMTLQFALAAGGTGRETARDPLRAAREEFLLRTELDLYRLFDAVIMINQSEYEFVRSRGVPNAVYVPQSFPVRDADAPRPSDGHQTDLLFVGSVADINVRGLSWFYRNVFVPFLWRHGVRLTVVGQVCQRLDFRDTQVTLIPRYDRDIAGLYAAAKVVVVPVFEGTGLCMKSVEALGMGCPALISPAGARGLGDAGGAFVTADMRADPAGTAATILDLLADPDRRARLGLAGRAFVRDRFSRHGYFEAMDRVIRSAGLDPAGSPAKKSRPAAGRPLHRPDRPAGPPVPRIPARALANP